MATAGDEVVPSESDRVGEKFLKMLFRLWSILRFRLDQSEIIYATVSLGNSSGISDQGETAASTSANTGISELEQTFTRFKIKNPATMEDLPDELLINIFIRLLAKQLAQMRSVSKSWNALLSDPSFVKSHLQHSMRNNNQQIFLVFSGYHEPFTQLSFQSTHLEPVNVIKHIQTNLPMSWVIRAVNGLICLSEFDYSNIHIWNPSLSAMSAIPPPHSLSAMSSIRSPHHYMSTCMRFGFDPKTDDYKLVKISGIQNSDGFIVKEWLQVEVYSMRKGSWEFITQPFPSHITRISDTDHFCVDGHHGHLHWENEAVVKTEETIVAFDLGSETFREIPLPDSILDSNHEWHELQILNGKLCEMSWCKDGGLVVWVMEEYGVPESWAKHHVFSSSQFNEGLYLDGFTSRGELLLEDEEGQLVLYNPIANKTKSSRTKQSVYTIVEFVDSLVWI